MQRFMGTLVIFVTQFDIDVFIVYLQEIVHELYEYNILQHFNVNMYYLYKK